MVFMGTSLADGAWGRESAVYRVSGVLSVIGGWFFTAFSAFIVAMVLATIFYFGGLAAVIIMICISMFVIYRTHKYHNVRMEEQLAFERSIEEGVLSSAKIMNLSKKQLKTYLFQYSSLLDLSLRGLEEEDLDQVSKAYQSSKSVSNSIAKLKNISSNILEQIPENELELGHMYILIVDYLFEMSKHTNTIIKRNLDHIDNNHKTLIEEQIEELRSMQHMLRERFEMIMELFIEMDSSMTDKLYKNINVFVNLTRNVRKSQIRRIKNHQVKTRNSVLFLNHLGELRNLGLFSNRIVRVLDELVLNPPSDLSIEPSEIKKEMKDLKKEVKNILKEGSEENNKGKSDSGEEENPE